MNSRAEKNKDKRREIKEEKKAIRKKRIKKLLLILSIVFILCILYARFIEPKFLKVHEEKLESTLIPSSFHGVKLVHFSDLHYGSTIKEKDLEKIKNKINELEPDIIVFTGDLIEQKVQIKEKDYNALVNFLNSLDSTIGKYIIYGNHDLEYSNFDELISETDFMMLNNNYDIVYNNDTNPILIFGSSLESNLDLLDDELLKDIAYKIVLTHYPDNITYITNHYSDISLVLSGHSHNTQVNVPILGKLVLPIGCKYYYRPYYKVKNTDLYISNGIGTSTLKLRFKSIPSINLFRLNNIKG